tara:strand:+ start:1749 stop:3308 length:1560 start_codon:yes stop_codon:yes gene_type:complete
MKSNILFKKENQFIIFLFLFSLFINQYYGNRGVFPVDSFSHFDTGYRILLNEHPFKDFWIISGPFVDYIQASFFYLFGVNWQAYVFHASIVNAIITISTFIVLRNFKLNLIYSFIYSIFFSILAYPISGTPFVDHHSAFFSLLGIYALILGIRTEKNYYWILLPIFFIFAFLSKQVPSSYVIISVFIVLVYYYFVKKKIKWIKYVLLSSVSLILLLLIFGNILGIGLTSFLEQYIFYPQTIGEKRFSNFNITFNGIVGHFKFIYFAIAPLVYVNIKNLIQNKNYFNKDNFLYFLILISLTISLIFHQLLTRNQTFIFFLIPILTAFSHISINTDKKIISTILILFCLFATTKYHFRFNEGRKFHELNYSNFDLSSSGSKIDRKFIGLRWMTPEFKDNPIEEINFINEIKTYLKDDIRNKMVMTNYSFFSALLEKKLFSTTRWHIFDGTDYPQKNSKYFLSYKKLLINSIKENEIKVIYTINPVKNSNIYDYIDEKCFKEIKITQILSSHELKNCEEIDN